jgi:hypothetical protein
VRAKEKYPSFLTVSSNVYLDATMVRGEGITVARGVSAVDAFDFVLDPAQYTKADTKIHGKVETPSFSTSPESKSLTIKDSPFGLTVMSRGNPPALT